jgi:hypothetical protein
MGADARAGLERLWHTGGGDPAALGRVTLTGADPLLLTDFKIGAAASAAGAATSLAAAELWGRRPGRSQDVEVDARAAITAFRSERYVRVDGQQGHRRDPLFGF